MRWRVGYHRRRDFLGRLFQNTTGLRGVWVRSLDMIGMGGLRFNTQQVLYIATAFLFNTLLLEAPEGGEIPVRCGDVSPESTRRNGLLHPRKRDLF